MAAEGKTRGFANYWWIQDGEKKNVKNNGIEVIAALALLL